MLTGVNDYYGQPFINEDGTGNYVIDGGISYNVAKNDAERIAATDKKYDELIKEYRKAPKEEKEKAQANIEALVKEAATMAGYNTPKIYHGTDKFGFTSFKPGMIFASSNAGVAAGDYPRIRGAYLN